MSSPKTVSKFLIAYVTDGTWFVLGDDGISRVIKEGQLEQFLKPIVPQINVERTENVSQSI